MKTPTCPNGHTQGFNTIGNAVMDCVICGAKPVMQSFPTDEQINIAMCEWMGWRKSGIWGNFWTAPDGVEYQQEHGVPFPEYLSDDSPRRLLNEAEARLAELCKEHDYWFFLRELLGFSEAQCDWDEVDYFKAVSATARQRVIAILQTIKPEMFQ